MEESEIAKLARRYPRVIRWSEENRLYIGSLPEIAPDCCHGNTIAEVAALLDDIAETSLRNCKEHSIPYATPGSAIVIIPQQARNPDTALMVTNLRKKLGLSQKDFATALGISISTLTKWETGDRRPDAAASKLLRILQQNPQYITA